MSSCAVGSYGASNGAKMAESATISSTTIAMRVRESRSSRASVRRGPTSTATSSTVLTSVHPDARIGGGRRDIGEQRTQCDGDARDEHGGRDERIVACGDGVGGEQS